MGANDLALDVRVGLPDALRVLLVEYPRDAWDSDPGFGGLIRFWLERHLMFRRLTARLSDDTRALLDKDIDPRIFATHLSRLGSMLIGDLHGHHMIEDAHYFPHLKSLDARVASGFEILDRDHHDIDSQLSVFTDAANSVLRSISGNEPYIEASASLLKMVEMMEGFLHRHLTDEEELVVPILLKFQPRGLV